MHLGPDFQSLSLSFRPLTCLQGMEPRRSIWRASQGPPLPGLANKATGSCQLPRPIGTHDAMSNQCLLVHLDLQLRRRLMAFCKSYLVDGFTDHIRHSESWYYAIMKVGTMGEEFE